MILTGYIGQFYESSDTTLLLIWGTISTLFFFHVLYLIYKIINEAKKDMPDKAAKIMNGIWYLFLFSWMLYPGAYLMPLYIDGEIGVVSVVRSPTPWPIFCPRSFMVSYFPRLRPSAVRKKDTNCLK
jgi:bacteriorhodopsin